MEKGQDHGCQHFGGTGGEQLHRRERKRGAVHRGLGHVEQGILRNAGDRHLPRYDERERQHGLYFPLYAKSGSHQSWVQPPGKP